MARTSLFSTYRAGENRVTSSMLAVFQRMDITRLEQLLGNAVGDSNFQLVTFTNQPGRGGDGVPDGRVSASFNLWLETKTTRDSVSKSQLRRHLERLEGLATWELLVVITPDIEEPAAVRELNDSRVVWVSFRGLSDFISQLVVSEEEVISEREATLLRELQLMFEEDGLLNLPSDTVVVPAGHAYEEYQRYSAYVCQPGRSFRPGLKRLAFYRRKRIEPLVPVILGDFDNVEVSVANSLQLLGSEDSIQQLLGSVVGRLIDDGARNPGTSNRVFILSEPDAEETERLIGPIKHEGSVAWVMNQRYVYFDDLKLAETTEHLE